MEGRGFLSSCNEVPEGQDLLVDRGETDRHSFSGSERGSARSVGPPRGERGAEGGGTQEERALVGQKASSNVTERPAAGMLPAVAFRAKRLWHWLLNFSR
jgi:hypothetical protein